MCLSVCAKEFFEKHVFTRFITRRIQEIKELLRLDRLANFIIILLKMLDTPRGWKVPSTGNTFFWNFYEVDYSDIKFFVISLSKTNNFFLETCFFTFYDTRNPKIKKPRFLGPVSWAILCFFFFLQDLCLFSKRCLIRLTGTLILRHSIYPVLWNFKVFYSQFFR